MTLGQATVIARCGIGWRNANVAQDDTGGGVMRLARSAWRLVVPGSLRRYGQPVATALARARVMRALRAGEPAPAPGPLVVSGLLSEAKGVSEAARLTLAGLRAAGLAPVAHDLRPVFDAGQGSDAPLPVASAGGVWILHVNAPEAILGLAAIAPQAWLGRYRIGYWAYELPRVPKAWVKAAAAFHELWSPSRFVADALLASGVTIPVRVMPHPVWTSPSGVRARSRFDLPETAFVVLAMGDLLSSATRKNLTGAIDIFRAAFPEPGAARLIIKTQSAASHPRFRAAAAQAAGGRPDIAILAEQLPEEDMRALIASADVLLSPHRAEGFGLPLAEAFLAGVPALATGWSGNMDFMAGLEGLQIRHAMTPVRDAYGVYGGRGLSWAEPDLADAAAKLRALAASPGLRRVLAGQGRAAVEQLRAVWTAQALTSGVLGRLCAAGSGRVDGRSGSG